jgi:hypothetical protein
MTQKAEKEKALADILFPSEEQVQVTESILTIPPEQRRLHTDSYDFTVSTVVDYLDRKRLVIPEYQRRYVWSDAQASRLIESLIIQCPIPVVYLNQEKDETLSVIDGNQRITTLKRYLKNQFKLVGLTAYPELEGFAFHELDGRFQRHIENRTIRCLVILKETHPQVKFDVFERLNTGSVKLTAQELRHGIYYGDLVLLCESLAKNKEFAGLIDVRDNKRMKLEELVLRFLAFKFAGEGYKKPLTAFLNSFCDKNRTMSPALADQYKAAFSAAVSSAHSVYGRYAFKIIGAKREVITPFNAAMFDAQMVAISNVLDEGKQLPSHKAVVDAISETLEKDDAFRKSVSQATSDEAQVKTRIRRMTELLLNA